MKLEELKQEVAWYQSGLVPEICESSTTALIELIDAAIAQSSTDATACSTERSTTSTSGTDDNDIEQRMRDIVANWKLTDLELALSHVCGMSKTGRDKWAIELSEDDTESLKIQSTLMRVLDSAIADQSRQVGDDVQRAIKTIQHAFEQDEAYEGQPCHCQRCDAQRTLISALSAYRKPVGDDSQHSAMLQANVITSKHSVDVQNAIDRLEKHDPMNESQLSEDIQFAITALQALSAKPEDKKGE